MAKIIDVRGADGNLVVLGDTFTLPSSDTTSGTPFSGSLRFNPNTGNIELYVKGTGSAFEWKQVGLYEDIFSAGGGIVPAHTHNISDVVGLQTELNNKASTSYVDIEISQLLGGAPSGLDTLGELANALGNDANFSSNINTQLSNKVNKNGDSLTGNLVPAVAGTVSLGSPTQYFGTIHATTFNGNATTTSALQSPVTIALTGDVTGSASFNGASNININTTVVSSPSGSGDFINVLNYGATGDGITDDAPAILDAIDDANGRTIYFPSGKYRINNDIFASGLVSWFGDGPESSELILYNDSSISITGTLTENDSDQCILKYLGIKVDGVSPVTAVDISYSTSAPNTATSVQVLIDSVNITGLAETSGPETCLALTNCRGSRIQNCMIRGSTIGTTSNGIFIYSNTTSPLNNAVEFFISKCSIFYADNGINADSTDGHVEGVIITDCVAVMCGRGYVFNANPTEAPPGMVIKGSHANTTSRGIVLNNVSQSFISDCLLYQANAFYSSFPAIGDQYIGIEISGDSSFSDNDILVHDNMIFGFQSGGLVSLVTGIVTTGSTSTGSVSAIFSGNIIANVDIGVNFANNTRRCFFDSSNVIKSSAGAPYVNSGQWNALGARYHRLYRTSETGVDGPSGTLTYDLAEANDLGKIISDPLNGTMTIGDGISVIKASASISNAFNMRCNLLKNGVVIPNGGANMSKYGVGGQIMESAAISVEEGDILEISYSINSSGSGSSAGNTEQFNPTVSSSSNTLTNNNLTATTVETLSSNRKCSITDYRTLDNKFYFEITINQDTSNLMELGFAGAGFNNGFELSSASNNAARTQWIRSNGDMGFQNGVSVSAGLPFITGDIIMIAVDSTAAPSGGTVSCKTWFGKNGVWYNSGNPATGVNPSLTNSLFTQMGFAVCLVGSASSPKDSITANFGASSFTYSAPAGYMGYDISVGDAGGVNWFNIDILI